LLKWANGHHDSRNIQHGAIYFCFQKIRRARPTVDVEAIDAQEKNVGIQRRNVSSAIGPTSEKEFFRRVPPVRITSRDEPASSAAIFTALVIIVRF
jgi:hypothetical protein